MAVHDLVIGFIVTVKTVLCLWSFIAVLGILMWVSLIGYLLLLIDQYHSVLWV